MTISTDSVKSINKQISRISKNVNTMRTALIDWVIIVLAYLNCLFSTNKKKSIPVLKLRTKSEQDIVINCLGCIDLRSETECFGEDIRAIRAVLNNADISFASSRFGKHHTKSYASLSKQLNAHRITDVAYNNKLIKSQIYQTKAGNVAVCACMMHYASVSKHHIRTELVREYYLLKRMGADYVIMYLDSKLQSTTTEKNKKLCDLLLKAGVDYIVNVKPGILDSGITFRQKNASVSRAVYSVGTFLSNRASFPQERAAIRIKLRKVNGKLQAFEESYYPLRWTSKNGMHNLVKKDTVLTAEDVTVLAKIERGMPRLRKVGKILRVQTVMSLCHAELPEKLAYLNDFSVGKVCARSFEVRPGDLFFFREQFADANDLVRISPRKYLKVAKKANSLGAMLLISHRDLPFRCATVLCNNVMEAHVAVCAYLRKQFAAKTICITGSIGKTSTKDMLSEVMKMQFHTRKSEHNTNVQVWIGENIQKLDSACEVYIQETGGGRPGGASRHARMVLPEVTVVTNIGDAHLGNFNGDQVALMHNKLGIIDGMPKNGVLFLNGDDPLLVNAQPKCNKMFFAVHNHNADYYADDIRTNGSRTTFKIVHKDRKVLAKLDVPGEHNVLNAVCAFAIGQYYGISDEAIVKGISNFKTQGIRQNIVQACGMKLFLDCFNASSGSVESSIKTLTQIKIPKHGRRVALLGDITGLGEMAESTHKEIATPLIENPADVFVFYGKNIRYTYEIVKEHGLTAHYVNTLKDVCALLSAITKPGDVVMAKGSSKMKLEYVLDCVYGTRFFDGVLVDDNAYYRVSIGGIAYNLFDSHSTAVKPQRGIRHARVRLKIGMVTTNNIASGFGTPELESVELPDTIRHIGIRAFHDSKKLKRIEGATKLKYIGMAAFKNCSSLEAIHLPETLLHIGNDAFMGCSSLQELYIPESVVQIGPRAFANCPSLQITCKTGSYAEYYLKKSSIPYSCQS